jgi:hypothetical protein
VTVHVCTVRSSLTDWLPNYVKATDRFSRYSKWLDTFRTALV